MSKHINFFGYTLWVSDDRKQPPDEAVPLSRCFYSPGVLASYCLGTLKFCLAMADDRP